MTFIRTLRNPARAGQARCVPGSLACAATRPFSLSASIRRADPPSTQSPTGPAPEDIGASAPMSPIEDGS